MEGKSYTRLHKTEIGVGILYLNRPDVLNALIPEMLSEICAGLANFQTDDSIRAVVITGNDRAFAAGADIKKMAEASPDDVLEMDTIKYWQEIWAFPKPLIAAVSGYAYGGGCELAMGCDLIIASETAKFAQPEIKLGIIPGAGGTQRLTKAIGPYRAMEMLLTGEPISAQAAYNYGLVNRVVPLERYFDEALELANKIAAGPQVAIRMARNSLKVGVLDTLRAGLEVERRNFVALFDTVDQKEGMRAFLEKRTPKFSGR